MSARNVSTASTVGTVAGAEVMGATDAGAGEGAHAASNSAAIMGAVRIDQSTLFIILILNLRSFFTG
jgi:outer membrane lipoprotein SlyB